MTTQFATRIMPVVSAHPIHPNPEIDRKGVNNVALFDSLRSRENVSPERSELEKAALRESANRRQYLTEHAGIMAALYGVRNLR